MANPFEMGQTPTMGMPNMPQGAGLPQFPQGAMAGFMQVGNQQRMEAAQELQRQANLNSLAQQLAQMEEYKNNAGWRDMERQAGTETARGTRDTAYAGAQTKLGEAQLGLRKGLGTEKSDVGAANAKNQTVMSDSRLKQMENLADELNTLELDPMTGAQQVSEVLDAHGVRKDHPLRQKLLSIQDPAEFKSRVAELSKGMQNSISQQRSMAATQAKEDAHMKRTEAEIAGRQSVANTNAQAHVTAATSRTAQQESTDKLLAKYLKQYDDALETGDPAKIQAAGERLNRVAMAIQANRSAGAPTQILPGAEGIERVRPQPQGVPGVGGRPQQSPQAQAPLVAPPGRVVIFKQDGTPAGHIPEDQAAAAEAQGYRVQR